VRHFLRGASTTVIYADDMKPEVIDLLALGRMIIGDNVRDFHGAIGRDVH
jgi:hypothetical protein